jgi:hypothetical protein
VSSLISSPRLLDEVLAQLDRGDYGWRQVAMNRARALQRLGQLATAEEVVRDLLPTAKRHTASHPASCHRFARPSRRPSHGHGHVLEGASGPQYEEIYLRSHKVDDQVGPNPSADPDDPMS